MDDDTGSDNTRAQDDLEGVQVMVVVGSFTNFTPGWSLPGAGEMDRGGDVATAGS